MDKKIAWTNNRIDKIVSFYERLLSQGKIDKDGYAHKRMKKIRAMRLGTKA